MLKEESNTQRKIIHIDMDAFYASVEQRDFPAFRGKPLAVGGTPDGRGVVATASYEARKFGVRSAMSSRQALQLCPDLLFTHPRFEVYKEVSAHVRQIFKRYTDFIEPLSLDEAYLDVTHDKLNIGSAIDIAQQIKDAIKTELDLTASAGVSVNKFVAKIASGMNKPDGLTFIGPSKIIDFLAQLPIEKFFGVGKVTARKMNSLGIFFGRDLKQFSESSLVHHFGKAGMFYYKIVRGIDNRAVQPNRLSKSIGVEDTFSKDLEDKEDMIGELVKLCSKVEKRMEATQKFGRTITLKVKFSDFQTMTRSKTLPHPIQHGQSIFDLIKELLGTVDLEDRKVRLLGVTCSNFYSTEEKSDGMQLRLF